MEPFFKDFIKRGILKKENTPWCILYDFEILKKFTTCVTRSFPPGSLHCFAVKANPVKGFLKLLHDEFKFGMECASIGEVYQSLKVCPPEYVVFDSPCKTREEIFFCLSKGVYMNADNFEELRRIEQILSENESIDRSKVKVGIRINPIVGAGADLATSTATKNSKFGIPITEMMNEKGEVIEWLFEKFKTDWSFVVGLHCHVGSVGMKRFQQTEGVKKLVTYALQLNTQLGEKRIQKIDIGGGLPTRQEPEFESYYQLLEENVPEIKQFQIITEFGRSPTAPSAVVISRVEYVKDTGEKIHVTVHCGADIFCRTALSRRICHKCGTPTIPMMVIKGTVFDDQGNKLKEDLEDEVKKMDIVGPLCFSGDIIIKNATVMPDVKEGDYCVFEDCGAYTIAVWSKYCSRTLPAVFLKRKEGEYVCLKKAQSVEDSIAQWD